MTVSVGLGRHAQVIGDLDAEPLGHLVGDGEGLQLVLPDLILGRSLARFSSIVDDVAHRSTGAAWCFCFSFQPGTVPPFVQIAVDCFVHLLFIVGGQVGEVLGLGEKLTVSSRVAIVDYRRRAIAPALISRSTSSNNGSVCSGQTRPSRTPAAVLAGVQRRVLAERRDDRVVDILDEHIDLSAGYYCVG